MSSVARVAGFVCAALAAASASTRAPESEITGSVRIPSGVNAGDARVELVYTTDDRISPEDERVVVRLDERGSFRFTDVREGAVKLVAFAPGSVAAPLDLGLTRAERVAGVELELAPAAGVHGRLVAAHGAADAGRLMSITWAERWTVECTSDVSGSFAADGFPAGRVEVTAWPSAAEIDQRTSASVERELVEQALRRRRRLELAAGETVDVSFAVLPDALARVRGSVRLGPRGGHVVFATNEALGTELFTRSDEDGAYDLVLPGAGDYELAVVIPFGAVGLRHTEEVRVEGAEFAHDISVPLGALELRVQERDGRPCAGAELECRLEEGEPSEPWSLARADDDGRLSLPFVPMYRLGFSAHVGERASPWTAVDVREKSLRRIVLVVSP